MADVLVEAALEIAWQQWTALGVAGTVAVPDHAIDVEALICFTPIAALEDPRLRDEALDWCVQHARRVVSISRLRQLRARLVGAALDAYDDFAAAVNVTARLKSRWPTQRAALIAKTSGKSRAPDVTQPALLQLRLRTLFGITARAELVLQFLRPAMAQEVPDGNGLSVNALTDTGFSKPALLDVLTDLTAAGVLERWRRGNRDYYALARVEAMVALLGGNLPACAPSWALRFRVAAGLLAVEARNFGKKSVVQAVALTRELERLRVDLERAHLRPPGILEGDAIARWAATTVLAATPSALLQFRDAQKR